MTRFNGFLTGRWAVPIISGTLIIASWIASGLAGAHAVANGLMLAAAVVAGWRIARGAVRALMVRDIGIDALVTVAAVGAILIGNYWEAAAVTFLFAVGNALESATLNKTRSALQELIAVAPDEAVVLRGGEQVTVGAAEVDAGELVIV